MTTHDDSYADASFDLDESIDEDIEDKGTDDNTPARRINVVDSDGDDDDSIHPRARRSSPPEPSPRSSPEEEAGAPEMTTPPSTGRTRLSNNLTRNVVYSSHHQVYQRRTETSRTSGEMVAISPAMDP